MYQMGYSTTCPSQFAFGKRELNCGSMFRNAFEMWKNSQTRSNFERASSRSCKRMLDAWLGIDAILKCTHGNFFQAALHSVQSLFLSIIVCAFFLHFFFPVTFCFCCRHSNIFFFFISTTFCSHFAIRFVINMRIWYEFIFSSILFLFVAFVLVSHVRQICALYLFACTFTILFAMVVIAVAAAHIIFSFFCLCVLSHASSHRTLCEHHIIWYEFRCKTSVEQW